MKLARDWLRAFWSQPAATRAALMIVFLGITLVYLLGFVSVLVSARATPSSRQALNLATPTPEVTLAAIVGNVATQPTSTQIDELSAKLAPTASPVSDTATPEASIVPIPSAVEAPPNVATLILSPTPPKSGTAQVSVTGTKTAGTPSGTPSPIGGTPTPSGTATILGTPSPNPTLRPRTSTGTATARRSVPNASTITPVPRTSTPTLVTTMIVLAI